MKAKKLFLLALLPFSTCLNACGTLDKKEQDKKAKDAIASIPVEVISKEAITGFTRSKAGGSHATSLSIPPKQPYRRVNANDISAASILDTCFTIAGDIQDIIDELDVYFENKGSFENKLSESDKDGYNFKLTTTYTETNGESMSLSLYYADASSEYAEGKDENEIHYLYKGAVSYETYLLEFDVCLDTITSDDGIRVQTKFNLYLNNDKSDCVRVGTDSPIDNYINETKFNVSVVLANVKITDFTIGYAFVENNMQVDFELGGNSFTAVRDIVDGETFYRVSIKTPIVEGFSAKITLNFKKVIEDSEASFEYVDATIGVAL